MKETEIKQMIHQALGLDELQHNTMVFECGLNWIRERWSLNEEGAVLTMAQSGVFWKWWRAQWEARDRYFVFETQLQRFDLPMDAVCKALCLDLYMDLHKVENIRVVPNRFVLSDVTKHLKERIAIEVEALKQKIHGKR